MLNNRKNDSRVEREIAAFLDKNLYSSSLFKDFKRTDTLEEQIHGSDVILSTSDGILEHKVIDEKVATRYANSGLETFSLELSFINKRGKKTVGWFLDCSKKTEYYLLGWILKADIPFNEKTKRWEVYSITKDNIVQLEWVLVSRQKIMKFLESKGWTLDKLTRQDEKIRQNGGVSTKEFIDEVSFRYSDAYIERPVNILLKKDTYKDIADYKGIISV